MSFEKNVFINCPFDKEYTHMLRALTFTLLFLDFEPKLSQTFSSSTIRINQIKDLIRNCKFGIHDLSRSKALKEGDLARFNMPFELGLDIGSAEYGGKKLKDKKTLILETDNYHYQKVLSDIAGQDISSHNDDPDILIKKVRDWISANSPDKFLPSPKQILYAYIQFSTDLNTKLSATYNEEEIKEMSIGDFLKYAKDWLKTFNDESI